MVEEKATKFKIVIYSGNETSANFYYHSGLPLTHAFLVIEGRKKTIITNSLNRGLGKNFDGKVIIAKDIFGKVRKVAGKKFFVDGSIPLRVYKKIAGAKVEDATELLYEKRMKKQNGEVTKIKKAASLTREIIEKFSRCAGKREEEVARELVVETYEQGLEPAFRPIVATGRNAGTPHAFCTKKTIEDFVLIDYGVKYKNYCADITRCYFFDSARASRMLEKYEKLKELAYAVIDAGGDMKKSNEIAAFYERANKKLNFPKPP